MIEDHKAEALSDDIKLVITSENKKQKIEIPSSNLICIESEGNYVNTWFLEEGKIIRSMVRITLKNIESQIGKSGSFFKCHRAYIVNLSHIEKGSYILLGTNHYHDDLTNTYQGALDEFRLSSVKRSAD